MLAQLKTTAIIAVLAITLMFVFHGQGFAFSTGPPDGRTGASGESTCADGCHNQFPLNSGPGSVTVTGLPVNYTAGQTYTLTVTVSQEGQVRWGFELTILDGSNNQVGTLVPTDGNTQTSTSGGRQYIKHTSVGTQDGTPDSGSWSFDWIAPNPGVGPVTAYVAGNAADSDNGNQGDYIYTHTDASLSVELSVFTATKTQSGVLLRWRTESEIANLGFNVYRIEDGKKVKVNQQIIPGHGTTGNPHDYKFLDLDPPGNVVLKYLIEDTDFTGKRGKSTIITVRESRAKRLLTLWGKIKNKVR